VSGSGRSVSTTGAVVISDGSSGAGVSITTAAAGSVAIASGRASGSSKVSLACVCSVGASEAILTVRLESIAQAGRVSLPAERPARRARLMMMLEIRELTTRA
jgi:hypothetical protein